jgi:hypothetical protein
LYVFELRPDRDSVEWARITNYETYEGRETLWIRTADSAGTALIVQGTPTSCNQATPIPATAITPYPTATDTFASYPINLPGCDTANGNDCPLATPVSHSDEDIVAFVLACESGNNPNELPDVRNNAYVIRNRMNSGLYRGSAVDVVSQQGQYQCYSEGARPGNDLLSLDSIDSDIRDVAWRLVNNIALEEPTDLRIRWYGLYTLGIASSADNRNNFGQSEIVSIVTTQLPQCTVPEPGVYVSFSPFDVANDDFFTTVVFSDSPCP